MFPPRIPGGRPTQAYKTEIADREPLSLEEFALDWASKTPINGHLPFPGKIRINRQTSEVIAEVPGLIARQGLATLEDSYITYLQRFNAMKNRILNA